jgi:hypothetical protein
VISVATAGEAAKYVLMLAPYLAALGMELQPAAGLRIACAVFVNMVALTLFV